MCFVRRDLKVKSFFSFSLNLEENYALSPTNDMHGLTFFTHSGLYAKAKHITNIFQVLTKEKKYLIENSFLIYNEVR